MSHHPEPIALWRFAIIAPLLHVDGRGNLKRQIEFLCRTPREHPKRGLVFVRPGTVSEWLYRYKKSGIEGLETLPRGDRGRSRVIDDDLAEKIETMVTADAALDGPGVLSRLREVSDRGKRLPSLSSLYRFLSAKGLDQRHAPTHRDHRAYAFDLAGDCWQTDVMYGPTLPTKDGRRRKTYLIAIIDDATRVIPHAEFYFDQNLRPFKDCLKQALLKRGVPRRLYMDNGKIFRSRMLLALAARLGMQIIHSRPYQPQGKAKIERWFRTVRMSFLKRIDLKVIVDLDHLNRLFREWIEGTYHVHPHRGVNGEIPLDRWTRLSGGIRALPKDADMDRLFLEEVRRRVNKDGTIALKGQRFEVGPELIGQVVTVQFDSFDLRRALVIDQRQREHPAWPVDLRANRRAHRRNRKEDDHGDQE